MNNNEVAKEKILNSNLFQNKNLVYVLYMNLCESITNILSKNNEENASYFRHMLDAYLTVYTESLDPNTKVDTEQFFKGLLRGVKINQISHIPEIEEILNLYSENLNTISSSMSYIKVIEGILHFNDLKKSVLIQELNDFFTSTFNNFTNNLKPSSSLNCLKRKLIIKITEKLPELLKKSDDLFFFRSSISEMAAEIIYEEEKNGNFNFIQNLRDDLNDFANNLNDSQYFETFKLKMMLRQVININSSDTTILTINFVSKKLHLSPEDTINILLELDFKLDEWKKQPHPKLKL